MGEARDARLGDQRFAQGFRDRLRAGGDAELGHRGAELRPRGVGRDEELASDRLVRVAVGEQAEHVPLSHGQAELAGRAWRG